MELLISRPGDVLDPPVRVRKLSQEGHSGFPDRGRLPPAEPGSGKVDVTPSGEATTAARQ